MAINAYVGLPGSGKSYGVVENVILPALKASRVLVTNIPLQLDAIGADYDIELVYQVSNDDLVKGGADFWLAMPGGAVIVLDEVWRIWPAGMKANDIPQYHKEFLAEHRHKVGEGGLTQEIVLIVQDLAQIANYVRGLVDTTYRAVKLDKVGAKNNYRVDVYSQGQKGPNYPKTVVSSFMGKYKPDVYKYYKSHTKSETGLPGMERVLDNRGVIWKHPAVKYGLPIAFLLFYFGLRSTLSFFNGGAANNSKPAVTAKASQSGQAAPGLSPVQSSPPVANPPSVPAKPAQPPPPAPSKMWRLVGYSANNGVYLFHLRHAAHGFRRLGSDHCRLDSVGDPECMVDGELVTRWTGQPNLDVFRDVPARGASRVAEAAADSVPVVRRVQSPQGVQDQQGEVVQ